jgi:hypothetical protein
MTLKIERECVVHRVARGERPISLPEGSIPADVCLHNH